MHVTQVTPESLGLAPDVTVRHRDFPIGCIGAGMIMAECHLAAYREAGFPVAAIASRTPQRAQAVAERWSIPSVHATPEELIDDPNVAVLDIAFPPDQQPALIQRALQRPHIKAILAQKPLALTLDEARALPEAARRAGKVLAVNQNMRFDQSMRALKQILDRGDLGAPIVASIEMRAIPHWQPFLADYDRLTIANMGIHHLDVLRFLFGDPSDITTLARPDPRTAFPHTDGITVSTLGFPSGLMAVSFEDVWSGPRQDGFDSDVYIKWRVEGLEGVAQGTIGWPTNEPSTLRLASARSTGGRWLEPTWSTKWFPQAFIGVMEDVQRALATGAPSSLAAEDNVRTMALVEAAYGSLRERRTVSFSDFARRASGGEP